jgi:hypothetical protein
MFAASVRAPTLASGALRAPPAVIKRLRSRWPTLILVDLSVHASWLNQVEIYHSIIQRKLLCPNDFESTAELARALNEFERRYKRDRRTLRLDVHPRRPRKPPRPSRRTPAPPAARGRRLTTTEPAAAST